MAIKKIGNLEIQEEAATYLARSVCRPWAKFGLFLFLVLTFLGMAGGGILGSAQIKDRQTHAKVEYQRMGRYSLTQDLKVTSIPTSSKLAIWFANDYLQHFYIKQILPTPTSTKVTSERIYFMFDVEPSKAVTIFFQLEPQARGFMRSKMGIKDLVDIYFSQFIFP